jgi:hypothetical protein
MVRSGLHVSRLQSAPNVNDNIINFAGAKRPDCKINVLASAMKRPPRGALAFPGLLLSLEVGNEISFTSIA